MKRRLLLLPMLMGAAAFAHHSYGEYNRDQLVTLEGTVASVLWGNPHVVISLKTEDRGDYSIEWRAISQLSRDGLTSNPIRQGDHLIVKGAVNRNPEKHILTLVKEIRRPSDGWNWHDRSPSVSR
jgi:hypothetical protein